MFGGFLAWGYTSEGASERFPKETVQNSFSPSKIPTTPAAYRTEGVPSFNNATGGNTRWTGDRVTPDVARKTVSRFATGRLGDVEIVDTDAGQTIIAIINQRHSGKASFVSLERRGTKYRISSQERLDIGDFRQALWTTELIDADEDGYEEVLFVGKEKGSRRRLLVLFVPNDHRTYSMLLSGETTANGTPRIMWLANAAGVDAAAYRTALRQKARALIGKKS
jgi:hypothetical protein